MSSDEEEETPCNYGTLLDPYDQDDVPKKKSAFQDISEQKAYDENGKRRFHGAFTGGFSAGYWNTVGTPEGFTPATFKSSRERRAESSQVSKPEDFMDDEDRGEFGIAPKTVQTTTDFTSSKRKRQGFHDEPIPGDPVLHMFLQPAHETVSVKILKKMGWKPGKGVGEKVTRKERKAARKIYTCYIPSEFRKETEAEDDLEGSEELSDEDEYSNILFEPDDIEPYLMKPKMDTFGIGYSGLSRHSVLGGSKEKASDDLQGRSHLLTVDKGRNVSIRGQAFGVGAFEEDDDDIYAKDDMSHYDFSLGDSDKRKNKKKDLKNTNSFKKVLPGFLPSSVTTAAFPTHPPPSLPRDYVPRNPTARKTRFSAAPETVDQNKPLTQLRERTLGRHDLSAEQRGAILGEEPPLNTPPIVEPSVEVEKPKPLTYEEKIAAITGRTVNFTSNTSTVILGEVEKETQVMVDEKTGAFRPFSSNTGKQERYERYIQCKQDKTDYADNRQNMKGDKITEWEVAREVAEFEQAYKLYKPLTGLMEERFTTAKKADGGILDKVLSSGSSHYVSKEKAEAARAGNFGKLTREVDPWKPDSLLCKRFNVPDPFNAGRGGELDKSKKKSYSIFEYLESSIHNKESYMKEQEKSKLPESSVRQEITPIKATTSEEIIKPSVSKETTQFVPRKITSKPPAETESSGNKRLTVAELFLKEKQKENEEKRKAATGGLAFNREIEKKQEDKDVKETIDNFNKIDLYKAIFLSDSESDTEKDQPKIPQPPQKSSENLEDVEITPKPIDASLLNVERNPSPPRGIFANLNFDRLNAWQNSTKMTGEPPKPKYSTPTPKTVEIDGAYGPKLPTKPVFRTSEKRTQEVMEIDDSSSDSSDSWVEVDKAKSSSNGKHKKEKKSHKKKHKKEKKKKSHKHHKSKHKKH